MVERDERGRQASDASCQTKFVSELGREMDHYGRA